MKKHYYIIALILFSTKSCRYQKQDLSLLNKVNPDSCFFNNLKIDTYDISIYPKYIQILLKFNDFLDTTYISNSAIDSNKIFTLDFYIDFTPNKEGSSNNIYLRFHQFLNNDSDHYYLTKSDIEKYFALSLWQISNDESHCKFYGDYLYTIPDSFEANSSKLAYTGILKKDTLFLFIKHSDLQKRLDFYPFPLNDTIAMGIRCELYLTSSPLNLVKDGIVRIDRKPKKHNNNIYSNPKDLKYLPVLYGE